MGLGNTFSLLRFIANHPLNRDQKLRALGRFARWQISQRIWNEEVVHEWVNGSRFLVRRGEAGLTQNVYDGLHEFADMAFLLHLLRPEDFFVDVGANAGSYTILACAAAGAEGYAVEPVPATYRRLSENLRINHLEERVKSFNMGLGEKPGSLEFTSDQDTVNHALAEGEAAANSVSVPMTTLDLLLEGRRPTLIKIDVEGFETPVLAGASTTLRAPTLLAVIMELNGSGSRYGYDEGRILESMIGYGFQPCTYEPFERRIRKLDGKNLSEGNTLFLRDQAAIEERLRSAAQIELHGKRF
jgi:FkbM family methyltransferase